MFFGWFALSMGLAICLGILGRIMKNMDGGPRIIIPFCLIIEVLPALLAYGTDRETNRILVCIVLWIVGGLAATTATYIELRPKVFAR